MKAVFVLFGAALVAFVVFTWPGKIADCEERGGTFYKGGCHGAEK